MSLNPVLLTQLETYGLMDIHLEQLLAICRHGTWGSLTWHCKPTQGIAEVEVKLKTSMSDSRHMRSLTKLLQKEP